MTEHECTKCGEPCVIDGDWPKYHAWCDTCGDYAEGFDVEDHAADVTASRIDAAELALDDTDFDEEGQRWRDD